MAQLDTSVSAKREKGQILDAYGKGGKSPLTLSAGLVIECVSFVFLEAVLCGAD